MSTAIISSIDCRLHKMFDGHPEHPSRIDAISDRLMISGLEYSVSYVDAVSVSKQDLLLVHDSTYLEQLSSQQPMSGLFNIDDDTQLCPYTIGAAQKAAGSGVQAVDLILDKQQTSVFCNIRPPGHHAKKNQAGGFCFYNNIAIAAAYALAKTSIERVAIIDFDVHHGNGTEDIFRDSNQVMFCSLFQQEIFPFASKDTVNPLHIKNALAPGAGSNEFKELVTSYWLPALREFKPKILFISAGFDAHREDDIAQIRLEDADYAWITKELITLKKDIGCLGIVSMLEGGYETQALARSVVAHVKALIDD